MLGSRRLRPLASVAAVVGVVVAAAACEPPPTPSEHVEVTYLDIPEARLVQPKVMLNNRGEVVVSALTRSSVGGLSDPVSYHWRDGQATRIGEGDTAAFDISDRGHVVGRGQSLGSGPMRPFVWHEDEWTTLPLGDFTSGEALAVNDHGTVAGSVDALTAAVWHEGELLTPPQELGVTWPYALAATAVNNRDEVLMLAADEEYFDSPTQMMLWEIGGEMTLLSEDAVNPLAILTLPGDRRMNGRGMVVVLRGLADDALRASVWHDGELTDLGTLGGDLTYATAINEWGQVVGVSTDANGTQRPVLWYEGEMSVLDGLDAANVSDFYPATINNWGQVVGFGRNADGVNQPYLWQNGRVLNLGELVEGAESWVTSAGLFTGQQLTLDLNDLGQVVATAQGPEGELPVMWEVSPTWGYYPDGLP